MDRLTHAEVGGPYSSREDAERAIRSGAFNQNAAELSVQEGDSDDGDPADGTNKTSAFQPFQTPQTPGSAGPDQPDTPDIHSSMPDAGPKTTKPSQIPGGGQPPGTLPQEPTGFADDTAPKDMPGPDPTMPTLGSVVSMIVRANPEMDEPTIARVASQVMRRLSDFHPYSMTPIIEDPLANRSPLSPFVKDKGKNKGGGTQNGESGDGGSGDGSGDGGSGGGSSPLPRLPLPNLSGGTAGGAAAGEAAAGESAAAEILPLLLA